MPLNSSSKPAWQLPCACGTQHCVLLCSCPPGPTVDRLMAMEPRADLLLRWNPGQTDWGPNLVSRMCTARERGEGICERTVGKRSAGLMGRIHRYDQALKTLRRAEGLPGESLIFRNRSTQEGTTIRTDAVVEVDGEGTRSGNRRSESNSVCVVCNELYTVLCVRGEQTLRSTIHEIHNY